MNSKPHLFGEVALDLALIDDETLHWALEFQHALFAPKRLGEILVQEGKLNPDQVNRILQAQEARRLQAPNLQPPAPKSLLSVGEIFDGFEILHVMSNAHLQEYLVRDLSNSKKAVLTLHGGPQNPRELQRVLHYQRLAQKLQHTLCSAPYKVQQIDPNLAYSVRRYIEGISLFKLLGNGEELTQDQSIQIVKDIGEALRQLHNTHGLHSNLCDRNIVLDSEFRAHLVLDSTNLGQLVSLDAMGALSGSVNYIAPEIGRVKQLDARSDLYSLGLIFYQCLTKVSPLQSHTTLAILSGRAHDEIPAPEKYAPSCPSPLRQILSRMLMKDRDQRYPTVNDFLSDLNAFQDGRALSAGSSQLWLKPRPRPGTAPFIVGGLGQVLSFLWNTLRMKSGGKTASD
ncbi:MAG: serine/threonine-protein kinase [Planctomycetota bacterium]|nr:serine/threonine-protein kinase [Planctomycetota bacterium]